MLLGFRYHENLTRRHERDSATAFLWRGPLDVLFDEENGDGEDHEGEEDHKDGD